MRVVEGEVGKSKLIIGLDILLSSSSSELSHTIDLDEKSDNGLGGGDEDEEALVHGGTGAGRGGSS